MEWNNYVMFVGVISNNLMFLSPIKAIYQKNYLKLNPYQLIFINISCLSWLIYAMFINDIFIMLADFVGFIFGLFYFLLLLFNFKQNEENWLTINEYKYREKQIKLCIMLLCISYTIIFSVLCFCYMYTDVEIFKNIFGFISSILCGSFYIVPITDIYEIVITKNTTLLYFPLIITSIINSTCWIIYGLGLKNMFVIIPPSIGLFIGIIQILLKTFI